MWSIFLCEIRSTHYAQYGIAFKLIVSMSEKSRKTDTFSVWWELWCIYFAFWIKMCPSFSRCYLKFCVESDLPRWQIACRNILCPCGHMRSNRSKDITKVETKPLVKLNKITIFHLQDSNRFCDHFITVYFPSPWPKIFAVYIKVYKVWWRILYCNPRTRFLSDVHFAWHIIHSLPKKKKETLCTQVISSEHNSSREKDIKATQGDEIRRCLLIQWCMKIHDAFSW